MWVKLEFHEKKYQFLWNSDLTHLFKTSHITEVSASALSQGYSINGSMLWMCVWNLSSIGKLEKYFDTICLKYLKKHIPILLASLTVWRFLLTDWQVVNLMQRHAPSTRSTTRPSSWLQLHHVEPYTTYHIVGEDEFQITTSHRNVGYWRSYNQANLYLQTGGSTLRRTRTFIVLGLPSLQLSLEEVERSKRLSRVHIHVERVIGLLKQKYSIVEGPLQFTLIKHKSDREYATTDKIVTVCAALSNLCDSLYNNFILVCYGVSVTYFFELRCCYAAFSMLKPHTWLRL